VELDGIITLKNLPSLPEKSPNMDALQRAKMTSAIAGRKMASRLVETDIDPRNQIRRGEVGHNLHH
jgi:hypothetical protein